MVVGRNKARDEVLRQFGVEKIYGNEEDIVAISKEVFDGIGPDVVYDSASTQATFDIGLASLRKGGFYWAYGAYHDKLTFDGNILLLRALTIMSDVGYADEVFSQVITALSDGRLNNEALRSCITARVPLEDTQEGGLRELVDNKAKHMKILIKISGEK